MLHAFTTFAVETVNQPSKAAFYVAGCLLALWAVVVSAMGISRSAEWPSSSGAVRGVIGVSGLLVVAAMATAVITA